MERHLTVHAKLCGLFHHVHRLLGQVGFHQNGFFRVAHLLRQQLKGFVEHMVDDGPGALLRHQIQHGLVVEADLDGALLGGPDRLAQRFAVLQRLAGSVLGNTYEGGEALAPQEHLPYAVADHAGRRHHDVHEGRGNDLFKGDVIGGGEIDDVARLQPRCDLLVEDRRCIFVRQQHKEDVCLLGRLFDGLDRETIFNGLVVRAVLAASDDDLGAAGILHVERLRAALVAVADDRDGLVLHQIEIAVLIVIDRCHSVILSVERLRHFQQLFDVAVQDLLQALIGERAGEIGVHVVEDRQVGADVGDRRIRSEDDLIRAAEADRPLHLEVVGRAFRGIEPDVFVGPADLDRIEPQAVAHVGDDDLAFREGFRQRCELVGAAVAVLFAVEQEGHVVFRCQVHDRLHHLEAVYPVVVGRRVHLDALEPFTAHIPLDGLHRILFVDRTDDDVGNVERVALRQDADVRVASFDVV